jgi:PAS domain S-box-containing protein
MIEDLLRYVDFGAADSQRLAALRVHAAGIVPEIADDFYARILASEQARAAVGGPERAARLRGTMVRWIDGVLAGPHDEAFFAAARELGRVHVTVAAPPRYVLGALSVIRNRLTQVAASAMPGELTEVAASLSKILDIEAALMMEGYAEHWLALVQRRERAERDRIEARLEGVEWALEQSSESANMLLIGLDPTGRVVLFNAAAASVTGYPADDVLGHDAFDMLFGDAAGSVRDLVLASAAVPRSLDLTVRTRGGSMHSCRFYVSRHTPWGADRPTHLLTAVDWEQERRAQRENGRRDRLAAISRLGSGFAHEIRNPLNGALLSATLLDRTLRKKGDGDDLVALVVTIDAELKRIQRLTDDFLAFIRPDAFVMAPVDIGQLCHRVVIRARAQAPSTSILKTFVPAERLVIEGDEARLETALHHLLSNALEALVGGTGTVIVRAVREPAHAAVDVEDNGCGLTVPADTAFDAFFTTKPGRTGLGLALVNRIALDHGGSVDVTSAPGKTIFCLRVPLISSRRAPGESDASAAFRTGVLLVDRHRPSATTLARLLALDGYDVDLDVSSENAPARRGGEAAVVVTDLGTTTRDEPSMIEAVRARWPKRTVFFATARPHLASRFFHALGGESRVFAKPIPYPLLTRELGQVLGRPHANQTGPAGPPARSTRHTPTRQQAAESTLPPSLPRDRRRKHFPREVQMALRRSAPSCGDARRGIRVSASAQGRRGPPPLGPAPDRAARPARHRCHPRPRRPGPG